MKHWTLILATLCIGATSQVLAQGRVTGTVRAAEDGRPLAGANVSVLGYNRVAPKTKAEVLLTIGDDPLLAVWSYGRGRVAAFTSDCAPHWAPPEFLNWAGYRGLWVNLVRWLKAAAK